MRRSTDPVEAWFYRAMAIRPRGVAEERRAVNSVVEEQQIIEEEQQMTEEDSPVYVQGRTLQPTSLPVFRRPPIDYSQMSVKEIWAAERKAYAAWRRNLGRLVIDQKLVLPPFENNLDIWKQLWMVVDWSDLVVMVVDARDPLFYRCPDLEAYVKEIDQHKRVLYLVNKADLVPCSVREKWAEYFRLHGILFIFWSAKESRQGRSTSVPCESTSPDAKIYGREELLSCLQSEAEGCKYQSAGYPSMVGFVGYPNVGKGSTIKALVKAPTGGKTKHFRAHVISDKLTLCDSPGLVFPFSSSSSACEIEMIASGFYPIHWMPDHMEAVVQVVANRVPRPAVERVYKISLPKAEAEPPLASELLKAYCESRRLPDQSDACDQILDDYIEGKLPHFELPPDTPLATGYNCYLDMLNKYEEGRRRVEGWTGYRNYFKKLKENPDIMNDLSLFCKVMGEPDQDAEDDDA